MTHSGDILTRRGFLAVGGAGVGAVALAPRIGAAAPTASEQANLDVVNAFCAAWGVPLDWDRLDSFLATECKFRPSQTHRSSRVAMLSSECSEILPVQPTPASSRCWIRGPEGRLSSTNGSTDSPSRIRVWSSRLPASFISSMARSPSGATTRSSRAQQEVDDEVSDIGGVVDDGRDRSDRTGCCRRAEKRDALAGDPRGVIPISAASGTSGR